MTNAAQNRRTSAQQTPAEEPPPQTKDEADRVLDEQLEESFPASDPPSILRRS